VVGSHPGKERCGSASLFYRLHAVAAKRRLFEKTHSCALSMKLNIVDIFRSDQARRVRKTPQYSPLPEHVDCVHVCHVRVDNALGTAYDLVDTLYH